MSEKKHAEVVVLGSGPGGYTAAFRAADLGKKVILVERYSNVGGVCLNVGCIPSKALLHAAKVIDESQEMSAHGIDFGKPNVNIDKLRDWKNSVVNKLTGGLKMMAKQRKVEIVHGYGKFTGTNEMLIESDQGNVIITFDNAIIAAGSRPVKLPFLPDDPRIIDSTGALQLNITKGRMLVLGGGIIGLEMATVYRALGMQVSIVEMADALMAGFDKDIIRSFQNFVSKKYENIWLNTKVTKVEAKKDGLYVTMEGSKAPAQAERFDLVLSAVGRIPNGKLLDAEKAGVNIDERGFIAVDKQQHTNVPHIFAIGDIVGQPMLAHKATPEGKIAAEVIAGKKHFFDPKAIPSVAYTDPEVSWTGMMESEAKAQGINYGVGKFPWMASGRALSIGRSEGLTKVIFNQDTKQIIGCAIVGPNAGELIAEATLAIEMG
ncbi:MAG: dihydrolipoyl dehydrogenase [Alcanivoracaceae bacterium]|nr:dihydrolipoyl dehydrogenase [Alcanivoracaceae bacterium]